MGKHFKIRTDHVNLKHILEKKKVTFLSHHLWLAKLLCCDCEIEYIKGKENVLTNVLPRNSSGEVFVMTVSIISFNFMEEIKKLWEKMMTYKTL